MTVRIKLPNRPAIWEELLHDDCESPFSLPNRAAMMEAIRKYPHRRRPRKKSTSQIEVWKAIETVVAPLRKKIAALEEIIKMPPALKPDDFDQWLAENGKKYEGRHVAFVPGKGLIADAATADELAEKLSGFQNETTIGVAIVPSCRVVAH
jgi:hypothetical protein